MSESAGFRVGAGQTLSEFEASLQLPAGHAPLTPEKSPQDRREYRVITLPNALTALLISDPDTEKAAASLDVNIGSFAEPSEALGLAHFLEHMLFMGTEKYPKEESYSQIINNCGGSQNAYTTREHTNYIFDVTKPHLQDVLDRFAQFFVAPLCLESAVSRELLAVNNEHEKNLQSDMWRIMQLADSGLNPAHPISRFSTGNFDTLRDGPKAQGLDVRALLLKFYKEHYSANLMKLCVLGAEPLDTLEQWVRASFSDVPNCGRPRPSFLSIPLALPAHTGTLTRVVPVKNQRSLEVEWLLPPLHHLYRAGPGRLVAHCIAHEAAGSLAHLLKARSLVNELRSGAPEENSSYSVYSLQMDLTETGLAQVETILALTFSYIAMLQRALAEQPDAWKGIYEEVAAVQQMDFVFREKSEPIYFCEEQAARLSSVPAQHVLSNSLLREYDPALLTQFVAQLADVRNMRARVIAPEFKTLPGLTKEQWYGTEHTVERLSETVLTQLRSPPSVVEFTLPPKNPFISSNFAVKHKKVDTPADARPAMPKHIQCFCHSDKPAGVHLTAAAAASAVAAQEKGAAKGSPVELFYLPDRTFEQPKAHINIQLASSFVNSSPRAYSLAGLWQDIVDDALSDINHFASEGLLGSYCWPTSSGLQLSFTGFDDKLGLLAAAVLPKLRGLRVAGVRDEQFARLKEQYQRGLLQYPKSTPLVHARDDMRLARLETVHSVDEQLAAFADVTAADIDAFAAEWFSAAQVYVLVCGNYTEDEAVAFAKSVQEAFQLAPLLPSQQPTQRCVRLDPSLVYVRQRPNRNGDESNSCALNTYEIGRATPHAEAHLTLLAHILADAVFDQLRTKEALGYIAQCYHTRAAGVLSLHVAVQSSDASAAYLDGRIEAFLAWFRSTKLAALCEETADFLEQNKKAVRLNLTEKEKNLGEVAGRLWGEIERRRFNFHHAWHVADEVEKISMESLLAFFDEFLAVEKVGNHRAKISVQYNSHDHQLPERFERDTPERVAFANEKLVVKKPAPAAAAPAGEGESAAAAPAAAEEVVFLPPVPVDPRTRVYVDELVEFRRSCPTYPASL